MDPAAAKQQIAERVKQANKFLVTVNANPTVDQLAACIGLTLLLNKMGKHATAVFSGKVPSTIEFLQPEKTLETNTDSLRDFIISLDKNKADKLRYKIEDQFVRIFITPYHTRLTEKDLVFSEGDFNVEVVVALGVTQRAQLDAAITAHGRILHDATVVSVNAGTGKAPDIGQINWQDASASSLSEMIVSISEAFGPGLIDSQAATAFLTGIVAETARFSNNKTSPKVMTMSAQLMAAGANQQLIVSKLEPPPPKQPPASPPKTPEPKPPKQPPPTKPEGVLNVSHDDTKPSTTAQVEVNPSEIRIDEEGNLITGQDVVPKPPEPYNPHAYLNPSSVNSGQPDWAAPYDLVPMDTTSQPGFDNEDVPSGSPAPSPSSLIPLDSVNELGMSVPTPVPASVDNARNAVETAIASAPFDPAFNGPIAALNAQPLSAVAEEEPVAPTPAPVATPVSDTPSLVLPADNSAPITATPSAISQSPIMSSDSIAPPPLPPPLMVGSGAVIPNTSQQQ
jgi:hypothetical protein